MKNLKALKKIQQHRNKKPDNITFEEEKKQLWKDIVVSYTMASNSQNSKYASSWADTIVKDFEDRFSCKN